MLGLVLTSCGQWEKAGEALLPAESDGEEYIVYVRCITAVHQIEMEAKYIF